MIDSKAKRGSVQGIGLPFRVWICEPSGSSSKAKRLSFLRYYSSASAITDRELFGAVRSIPALLGNIYVEQLDGPQIQRRGLTGVVQ